MGMRDPVDRLAEIKANDPKRRALTAIFEIWETAHHDTLVKASDLDITVIELIDTKSGRKPDGTLHFSRQRVARFLTLHVGTRVSGYSLAKIMLGPPSKEVAHYKLTKE
jgi:hypothetical protein